MKKLLPLILSLMLLLNSIIFLNAPVNADTGKGEKVRVIYYRFDQNYDSWNLWIWPKGQEGSAYYFTAEEELSFLPGKKVVTAEIDVSSFDTDEAGIIVRKGEWEQKDVEKDRFFSMTKVNENNTVTLYLIQGIEKISYSENEAKPYFKPKIELAEFTQEDIVRVTLQAPAEALGDNEGFKLYAGNREIKIREVIRGADGKGFVIKLNEGIDLAMTYVLSKDEFGEATVSKANLFNTENFNSQFYYDKDDLGAVYKKSETLFRLWAPTADKVVLKLYDKGDGGAPTNTVDMVRAEKGTWYAQVKGDLNGVYYTYEVTVNGQTNEAVDPYAKAVGVNGNRGMVVDLSATNPKGWEKVGYVKLESPTDAVIYEMHIRDTSIDSSSGIKNKGKYLGFTEINTKSPESGVLTGISHVKELGATHIHLLPSFDFNSVDEKNLDIPQFNWGYDPKNYNAPEGSYSTDPFNGDVRIREFKEMVKAIKSQGIGVVMDVVYNHTALSADSDFNKIVPGYYYRMTSSGAFSNGSGCGNELASERLMVRKFIVDSVVYWAKEYKIDGFRFDLMGLHDTETMNEIAKALKEVNPSILIYGEGWTAGASTLPQNKQAVKANISKVPDVAVFNDSIRDGIKGHVFDSQAHGFISGKYDLKESVKFGITGAVSHPGVDYSQVNYDKMPFALSPGQSVNYVASHDNLTFYDKLLASTNGKSEEELKAMTKLGSAIVITSQGIPFMLSGTDFMRTKQGDENSYKSPDSINAIDWELKSRNMDVFEYHKGLIALRKAHPAFRMKTAQEVAENLKFIDTPQHLIAYTIENNANGDSWKTILVAFNASDKDEIVNLPVNTQWNIVVNGEKAGVKILASVKGDSITVPAMSAIVAYDAETAGDTSGKANTLLVAIGAGFAIISGILGALYYKKRKKDNQK